MLRARPKHAGAAPGGEARSATRPSRWSRAGDCACTALPTACARAPVPHTPVRECSLQRATHAWAAPPSRAGEGSVATQSQRCVARKRAVAAKPAGASTTRMHNAWVAGHNPPRARSAAPRRAQPRPRRRVTHRLELTAEGKQSPPHGAGHQACVALSYHKGATSAQPTALSCQHTG